MKQEISPTEQEFVRDGFRANFRADGRSNTDPYEYSHTLSTVDEAFGSATVKFGDHDTQIICAIKAEIQKPLKSEPTKGQVSFHLESSQTGSSLFTHEAEADVMKQRLVSILDTLYGNSLVNREELMICRGEYVWHLFVDILVLDELSLNQIDMIAMAIRYAVNDLRLPQVIATLNANSNKTEIGLVEEIYTDRQNTDQTQKLKSAEQAPYVVSVALVHDTDRDIVVLDADATETQCVD
jgi:exosome complex RNA-binding protein Rrp42 (RNase PH superfamily)